jgi:hypothetical protein
MTLTSVNLTRPFLSPSTAVAEDDPRMTVDVSAEGMRRRRFPFAVDPAGARATTTDDEASGKRDPQAGAL